MVIPPRNSIGASAELFQVAPEEIDTKPENTFVPPEFEICKVPLVPDPIKVDPPTEKLVVETLNVVPLAMVRVAPIVVGTRAMVLVVFAVVTLLNVVLVVPLRI